MSTGCEHTTIPSYQPRRAPTEVVQDFRADNRHVPCDVSLSIVLNDKVAKDLVGFLRFAASKRDREHPLNRALTNLTDKMANAIEKPTNAVEEELRSVDVLPQFYIEDVESAKYELNSMNGGFAIRFNSVFGEALYKTMNYICRRFTVPEELMKIRTNLGKILAFDRPENGIPVLPEYAARPDYRDYPSE